MKTSTTNLRPANPTLAMQSNLTRFKLTGRRGFALVITLSLMILLTILAVGLLSLATIELRTSSVGKNQAVARANAMMALNIALGELQRTAGPDQRVTARADIYGVRSDTIPGLTEPSKSKWTGVWNTDPNIPLADQNKATWLISSRGTPSNEGPPIIETASNIKLVGTGSAGGSDSDKVVAELIDIKNPDDRITGRYGWWVGDEGIKARVNLNDPDFDKTTPEARIARIAAPGASDINILTQFNSLPITTELNTAMEKAVSDSQLRLVSPNVTPVRQQTSFHDMGTVSQGVIANVREGGLKRDLSRALYDNPSPVTGKIYSDAGGVGPDWAIARSWASLKVDTTTGFPTAPVVQAQKERGSPSSPPQHGVGPIISRFGIEWWGRIERVSGAPGQPGSTYTLGVGIRPVLQLTNPYNVRLPARSYKLSLNFGQDGGPTQSGIRWEVSKPPVKKNMSFTWATLTGLPASSPFLNGLGATDFTRPWFNFTTPAIAIEPGQTLLFMPGTDNWAGVMRADGDMPLALGENTGAGGNNVGGVLRFPIIVNAARTVTWEELNAATISRFGEDRGENWDGGAGRNLTIHLALNGSNPGVLGDPLSRIERKGSGKFEAQNWGSTARNWARTGDQRGRVVQTFDHYFGYETVSYFTPQIYVWARDFNPRFPFPSDSAGRPLVNGAPVSDPQRIHDVWNMRYGHSGWQSSINPTEFPAGGEGAVFWGNGQAAPLGQARIVLFDLPTADILSPGQLQHVNLGVVDRPLRAGNRINATPTGVPLRPGQAGSLQPTYVIGNSYRDPAVGVDDITFDWSYRANEEIWDKWFVSGVPENLNQAQLASGKLANPRMNPLASDNTALLAVKNIDQAASQLLVKGMFNMNSTSVEAWKVLLGSTANSASVVAIPGDESIAFDPSTGNDASARYSRTIITNQAADGSSSVGGDSRWSGPIKLSDAQLTDLAKGIVQRIKNRAQAVGRPSFSLSEFINRQRGQEMGLLQETFDQRALPPGTPGGTSLTGGRLNRNFLDQFKVGSIEPEGAPGALRQGDLLQSVGSFINVRSDTFRIRAYGEKRNEQTGAIEGRAWCEAIVQRVPTYVDPSTRPEARITPSGNVNFTFGRRFEIKSFRWLTSSEI